jgi:hypothetical protein
VLVAPHVDVNSHHIATNDLRCLHCFGWARGAKLKDHALARRYCLEHGMPTRGHKLHGARVRADAP